MIRDENEYRGAMRRPNEARERLERQRLDLEAQGLTPVEVKRVIDPARSFCAQIVEEVEGYERLKRGELGESLNLHGMGQMLVALRIALGLTQRELAERLGVHESQVSRDERNEYRGITLDRASRILDALRVQLRSAFDQPVLPDSIEKSDSSPTADR